MGDAVCELCIIFLVWESWSCTLVLVLYAGPGLVHWSWSRVLVLVLYDVCWHKLC